MAAARDHGAEGQILFVVQEDDEGDGFFPRRHGFGRLGATLLSIACLKDDAMAEAITDYPRMGIRIAGRSWFTSAGSFI